MTTVQTTKEREFTCPPFQECQASAGQALEDFVEKFQTKEDAEEVAFDLANDCRDLKKNKVALAIYQKVAESWPGTDEAIDSQTNTAKLYISLKDDPNAEAAIGRLLTDFDQHNLIIRSIEDVANAWVEARRHEKAGELYKYIVKHWASGEWAVEAQTRLARMYIQIGDYEKADASAAELIESFSNAEGIAAAVEDVADMYQMVGSQAKSYPLHRYVVEHWPEHERAIWCQMKAIMSQLRLGDLAKAEEDLGSLLSDFAGNKELGPAVHEVVEEYRNTGAYKEGRELFAYIMENWDETPDTVLELQVGVALQSIKLGELDKADAAVRKLIADYNEHPRIAKALSQIAEEHLYAKNYENGIELWELIESQYTSLDFASKDEVPYLLATCYERSGDYNRAIEYYEQMLERYPHNKFACRVPYRLGMIYMRGKTDYQAAIYWFDKQNRLYDNELLGSRALRHQAHIYSYKLKDYENAKACYERYVTDYPNGESIWGMTCNLARCYEKLGIPQEAVRFYELAMSETTNPALINKTRERISVLQEGEEQ